MKYLGVMFLFISSTLFGQNHFDFFGHTIDCSALSNLQKSYSDFPIQEQAVHLYETTAIDQTFQFLEQHPTLLHPAITLIRQQQKEWEMDQMAQVLLISALVDHLWKDARHSSRIFLKSILAYNMGIHTPMAIGEGGIAWMAPCISQYADKGSINFGNNTAVFLEASIPTSHAFKYVEWPSSYESLLEVPYEYFCTRDYPKFLKPSLIPQNVKFDYQSKAYTIQFSVDQSLATYYNAFPTQILSGTLIHCPYSSALKELCAEDGPLHQHLQSLNHTEQLEFLAHFVHAALIYTPENQQQTSLPEQALYQASGDCEDFTLLLATLTDRLLKKPCVMLLYRIENDPQGHANLAVLASGNLEDSDNIMSLDYGNHLYWIMEPTEEKFNFFTYEVPQDHQIIDVIPLNAAP